MTDHINLDAFGYQLENYGLSQEAIEYRTRKKQLENAGWELRSDASGDYWYHDNPRTKVNRISDREVFRMNRPNWWHLWEKYV